MTQIQLIDSILLPSRLDDALPSMSIGQLAVSARSARTLGQLAVDMMSVPEFGGFGEEAQTSAGAWMEGMALALIEASDRCIAELRKRRPNSNDDHETRALALIEYAAITNEGVPAIAALAASLAAQRH